MNEIVILRPDGMYLRPIEKWVNQETLIEPDAWLQYFNYEIETDDDPTLLDLFTFINKASSQKVEIANMLFGQNLALLLADMSVPTEEESGISHLEISHFTELFKPTHGTPWFTHDFELHGITDGHKRTVSMVPTNLLANLPIDILDMSKLCIVDWNNKEENSYDFKTRITVRDFLNAIIREISFYGNNEEKKRLVAERSRPRRS